jgi:lipopolysaccharide biosynthesis regulator YciM
VTETALLAVVLAGIAGVLAGRAWAAALRRGDLRDRPGFRSSPHYFLGLHALAAGQLEMAVTELAKVAREDPDAVEVLQVLGNLLREAGQVERAIQVHQGLLARPDLTRAERAHGLAALGADFRKAGFLDRATATFEDVLAVDAKNIHALIGLQKLQEDQRHWREAYDIQTRLSRLRKTDDSLVLGHLQAAMGTEAMQSGRDEEAEKAFRTALSLDRRVFPAHLGLSDLAAKTDAARAAALLESAIQIVPERAYLAFDRLARLHGRTGEPARFAALCERIIAQDPRDWRARLHLARHARAEGRPEESRALLLRALESNPQVLLLHLEIWRTLGALGVSSGEVADYVRTAEAAVLSRDPHVCTACRYRADDMLWRCPHCHEWGTFVEERVGLTAAPHGR